VWDGETTTWFEIFSTLENWIRLEKAIATLGEELPPKDSLSAKRKEQSPDPRKRVASREEFG